MEEKIKACLFIILTVMIYGFFFACLFLHKIEEHLEKIKKLMMETEKEKKT